MFVLSDSPAERDLEWSNAGIDGCKKFIAKLTSQTDRIFNSLKKGESNSKNNNELNSQVHATIKNVTEDILAYRLNKAIARIRELFNHISDEVSKESGDLPNSYFGIKTVIQLLNPFIPHITEELWQKIGNNIPLYKTSWPSFDESKLQVNSYTVAIQINGRLRATHDFSVDTSQEDIKKIIINLPAIQKYINGAEIKKFIIVPQKIVNIVV
jgi:leucyl-tRNA synthetase